MGDSFDHGDDVVAGFFEPLVGVVDDAAGFVGFDVVEVDDPLEGCAAVDDVAVGVGRDVDSSAGSGMPRSISYSCPESNLGEFLIQSPICVRLVTAKTLNARILGNSKTNA